MKKLFAALLTLCMVFGMAVPAFAAGDPLTILFYYGGADYGRYKEGWIDVGNIDTCLLYTSRSGRLLYRMEERRLGRLGNRRQYRRRRGAYSPP